MAAPAQTGRLCMGGRGVHVMPCAGMCAQVLPPAVANGLDGVVRGMAQDLNSCMRIFTTPMPFAYIVHLRCWPAHNTPSQQFCILLDLRHQMISDWASLLHVMQSRDAHQPPQIDLGPHV